MSSVERVLYFEQACAINDFDFLPANFMASVKERINVMETTKDKIKELVQKGDMFEKAVIIQDLLKAGKERSTPQERELQFLAVELYLKSEDVQEHFMSHITKCKPMLMSFSEALLNSYR